MNTRKMPVVALVLTVVGLAGMGVVTLAYGGYGPAGDGAMGMGGHGGGLGVTRGDRVDAMFITQMIPHHEDAIAMSELALERSRRPEIRRLAEDIRRSQTEENAQMRAWYREWYGAEVSEGRDRTGMMGGMGMMGGLMHDATDLEALETATDFDREFLEQMIPHHEMAVMMTRMVGAAGGREQLRELTDSMRRAQTREIELMERWYRDWYGR